MKVSVSRFYENLISSLKRSNWLLTIYLTNLPNAPSSRWSLKIFCQPNHSMILPHPGRMTLNLLREQVMIGDVGSYGWFCFVRILCFLSKVRWHYPDSCWSDFPQKRRRIFLAKTNDWDDWIWNSKVINVESPTPSLDAFLASKGVCLAGKQFEMVLTL